MNGNHLYVTILQSLFFFIKLSIGFAIETNFMVPFRCAFYAIGLIGLWTLLVAIIGPIFLLENIETTITILIFVISHNWRSFVVLILIGSWILLTAMVGQIRWQTWKPALLFYYCFLAIIEYTFYAIIFVGSWILLTAIVERIFSLADIKTIIITLIIHSFKSLTLLVYEYYCKQFLGVFFRCQSLMTIHDTVALIG